MKLTKALATAALCCVLLALSCASTQPVATSKETPAAPPPVVANKPNPEPAGVQDYLGESIKLVGIGHDSGGPYTVRFYTAEVLTPPSAATKNEGLVKPTGKVADSSETEFWTPYIASSRPALKDELKPGMVVFAMGDASKRSRDDLARTTRWSIYRVKDTSNLYKGTVILTYNNTYGSSHWKEYEFHVDNIRILVGDISLELVELP